jgi:hypothetical protein
MNAGRQRQQRGSRTISAAEMLRLDTWAPDIAAEVRGEIRSQTNSGYRVGAMADAPLCGLRSPATLHPNPHPPTAPLQTLPRIKD